jgi:Flp pilus assembly protein TadG
VIIMNRPTRRRSVNNRRRRGAAATEFAIVAPVFFLMIIGFIEVGRALMVQQVLINASRVGARMASTTGSTSSGVQTAVQD